MSSSAWSQPGDEKKAAPEKRPEQNSSKPEVDTSNDPGKSAVAKPKVSKKGSLESGIEDVVPLLGPDGQIILIPRSENYEEFQKWLRSREIAVDPMAPEFSVSSVSLEGTVEGNDDSATVVATISVMINKDDGDVLVPLRLNESTLLKVEHRGSRPQFEKFDQESGYRCWLGGKGQHDLILTLAVPILRQATAKRVLLSLPITPVSGIKLVVPLPKVSVKGPDRGVVRTSSLDQGRSQIQAFGLGNLLDLSWQTHSDNSATKTELQASTYIEADLRAEVLVLEVTQLVRSIQGTFDRLTVRLPPEFELLEGVSGREVKSSATVPGSPARVAIELTAPTQGPIELKWVLSAKVAANAGGLPPIEGFEVADARRQAGFVKVNSWDGITLRKRDGEDRFLHQASESELRDIPVFLPATGNHGNSTAFRFLKQPFRLVLDIQKIEPYFSADPVHVVKLSSTRIDWDVTIPMRVFRGSLSEITLPWPRFKTEGWEQVTSETPELIEQILVEETPNGMALRLRLVDRKNRSDGEFKLRLKAQRPILVDGTAFDLSFPSVASSGREASRIILSPAVNLEVSGLPKDPAMLRPDEEEQNVLRPTRRSYSWRCESGSPEFSVIAKIQQQTIQTQSISELSLDGRTVSVTQKIAYDVAFEPLSQLRLMIPKVISDRIRLSIRDESGGLKPLTPFFTGLEIDQQKQCRLPLEQTQIGKFEVIAEFDVERQSEPNGDESTSLSVPVLQSSDAEFSATRVRWKAGERVMAAVDDAAWQPELVADKIAVWKVSGPKSVIALKLTAVVETALQDFSVRRAVVRTVLSEGQSHSQALFEFDSEVQEITLVLPLEISQREFRVWWNRMPIEPVRRKLPTGEVQVRIRSSASKGSSLAETSNEHGEKDVSSLWLDYYSQESTEFTWTNSHRLVVPKFATTVWVAQTVWEVVLPIDQHLLTSPRGFAAQFHWGRGTLFWSRASNFGYDQIEQVLSNADPSRNKAAGWETVLTNETSGNVYPLSCFGSPPVLVFQSMSRSAVVGCGAGLALVFGFLLIRMPTTRHVLTFLVVGFAMSLAALWFAEPVKVLTQPAILGVVMAIIAATIDRVGRRDASSPLVTLSSPSDFFATGSSVVPGMPGGGSSVDRGIPLVAPVMALPVEPISASSNGGRE